MLSAAVEVLIDKKLITDKELQEKMHNLLVPILDPSIQPKPKRILPNGQEA